MVSEPPVPGMYSDALVPKIATCRFPLFVSELNMPMHAHQRGFRPLTQPALDSGSAGIAGSTCDLSHAFDPALSRICGGRVVTWWQNRYTHAPLVLGGAGRVG